MILTRFVVVLLGSLMLAASVGLGLGWLSRHLFVAALGPCFYGLAAGAGAGFVALMVGLHHKSLTFGAAVLGVLAGWLMFTAMDDFHFREAWAREWAETRMVSSGLPSAELTQGEQDFFGAGATEELERQERHKVSARRYDDHTSRRVDN